MMCPAHILMYIYIYIYKIWLFSLFSLNSMDQKPWKIEERSILHPCIFLHRKIYGWRLVRECDVICCGPSCEVGFWIWQVWFCLWDYWFCLQTGSPWVSLVVWSSDSHKQWAIYRMAEKVLTVLCYRSWSSLLLQKNTELNNVMLRYYKCCQ